MTPETRYHVSNLLCPRGGTRTKRTASMLLTYDRSNETRRIRQNVSPTLKLYKQRWRRTMMSLTLPKSVCA